MKVAFALVAHVPQDERVYYQQAGSLKQAGCEVSILSTWSVPGETSDPADCSGGSQLSKKAEVQKIVTHLRTFQPDVVICDNPVAVAAANTYKKEAPKSRILYDITEWYPSKKNLKGYSLLRKTGKSFLLMLLSLYASFKADGFIFGEYYKAKPFRLLFPRKKHLYLPYYASPQKIVTYPVGDLSKECKLFYAGNLTKEKGFDYVMAAAIEAAKQHPETAFSLKVITKDQSNPDFGILPGNLTVQRSGLLDYSAFCREIGKHDLFLDLREDDLENTRCLPIKLFYYMAAGRPVIYTRLKSIRKEVPEIDRIGFLVNPRKIREIVSCISFYLDHPQQYREQCITARKLAEDTYNWEHVKNAFINFVRNDECV